MFIVPSTLELQVVPNIVSDIVDAYVFRKANARVQFLVLRRDPEMAMGNNWQAIHGKISGDETAVDAANRVIIASTGMEPVALYSADFISQFYDHTTDSILLAPTFAAQVSPRSRIQISKDYVDYAWCDLEETTARLPLTNQRWAVRHIFDVIALAGDEAELYRI